MPMYDLTPLGPNWGLGRRILEIVLQSIALLIWPVIKPVSLVAGWITDRLN